MSNHFTIEDVTITREPSKVIRMYEGSIVEFDEEFPFNITTEELPEFGKPETITLVEFTEGDPHNKKTAIAAIKDNF
jgi:hypothetical protein